MIHVFVSYRREDSRHQAGRLFDHLVAHFGKRHVFKDVDSIPLGMDFREILTERVAGCDVFLAIIGDGWLSAAGESGSRRLDDPGDFVRIEIEAALGRSIPVIPVLVGNCSVPRAEELPESLRELSYRHGISVRPNPDFHHDVDRLICGIKAAVSGSARPRPRRVGLAGLAAVTAILGVLLLGIVAYATINNGRNKIGGDDPKGAAGKEPVRPDPTAGGTGGLPTGPAQASVGEPPAPPAARREKPAEAARKPVVRADSSGPPEQITNSIGVKLVLIPAGEFLMGSPDENKDADASEKPQRRVRITRPFYLGVTEVTVGQFRHVVEWTKYRTEAERNGKGGVGQDEGKGMFRQDPKFTWRNPGFPQGEDHPVTNVSWNDAVAYCNALSQLEGLKPYYQIDGDKVSVLGGDGYRLPTEAEWEYACRAGDPARYSFGDDAASLGDHAWFGGNSENKTHPVGRKQANKFGLFDMHGNVLEWCGDWYGATYYGASPSPVVDPSGPFDGSGRVIRGGSWCVAAGGCRAAYRYGYAPTVTYLYLGLRLARVPSGQ
jgi:sulfatase modifying factor 1